MKSPCEILLRHGLVVDGGGGPARQADVAVADGRIEAIETLPPTMAARHELDASGLIVCPGFIDVHSHSDAYLLVEPDAPSKIRQGITTEVVGQCGCSAAPLLGEARHPADWQSVLADLGLAADDGQNHGWVSVAAYREMLERAGHAPNVVCLVGHNTLRAGVVGYAGRPAAEVEVTIMARRLEQALDEGASGLSTGLIYVPGRYAESGEVLALAEVTAHGGGLYTTHMRSEGDRLLEALEEVLGVARHTGMRVQISHLKTSGKANWHKLDAALETVETARAAGLPVHADRYPYIASGTDLDVLLPGWAAAGGHEAVLARLGDERVAARIAAEIADTREPGHWDGVVVGATAHRDTFRFRGQSLAAVAAQLNCAPVEAALQLLRLDELRTGAFFFGMSEANMRRIYARPWVMVGSDASIRATTGPLSGDFPHPRAYGAFARFLRMALDGSLGLTLEETVRRMTSLPAASFGLSGRGRLERGAWADLAVIDPRTIRDRATFAAPHQYAAGVRWTIVNGQIAYDGEKSLARAGRWLSAVSR
ncbi:MAG: D-aminoacylase [Kiritimatiellae bacterium]|nr:D-aminoacylase [Kiritimatiellia bacterium]